MGEKEFTKGLSPDGSDALAFAEQDLKDRWEMTFDFIKHVIDHPEAIESIPDGAELDFG